MIGSRRDFLRNSAQLGGLVVAAGATGLVAGCGTSSKKGGDAFSVIKREKRVRIGTANFKPYSYSLPDGSLKGFVIEVISAALAPAGVTKVQPIWVGDTSAYIPGLNANKYDIIANGMYIKPERCAQVAFTNPFYRAGMGMLVHKGNPKGIHSVKDIADKSNVKVATLTGTTQVKDLEGAKVPNGRVSLFPQDLGALRALKDKRVDALYLPQPEAAGLLIEYPELEMAAPYQQLTNPKTNQPAFNHGALAIRKKDSELAKYLNERLAAMQQDGTIKKIFEQNRLTAENLNDGKLASNLCEGA